MVKAKLRPLGLEDVLTLVGYVILTIWAILALFPLYWMIKNSLEPNQLLSIWPPRILPNLEKLTPENYLALLQRFPLLRWFFNSLVVAVTRTAGAGPFWSIAGYGFS